MSPANSKLKHYFDLAEYISTQGGPDIQRQSDKYVKDNGLVPMGDVAVTYGGKLRAKYVIHTVMPINRPDKDPKRLEDLLQCCILNALEEAKKLGDVETISIPAIG